MTADTPDPAPVLLYGPADAADALGVAPAVVSNWMRRNVTPPTPAPDYVRTNGAPLWASLEPWHAWQRARTAADGDRLRAEAAKLATKADRLRAAAAKLATNPADSEDTPT